jgi:hypothetical protein
MSDTRSLRDTINKAKLNIKTMEKAINKENKTIAQYHEFIDKGNYDKSGLLAGIEQAEANIDKFKHVILKEKASILECREMIKILDEKKRIKETKIIIEREDDGD